MFSTSTKKLVDRRQNEQSTTTRYDLNNEDHTQANHQKRNTGNEKFNNKN